jgi:anaerobic selenocysteine-containing dehydrogenase
MFIYRSVSASISAPRETHMSTFIHTRTCHLCEAACGLLMTVENGKVVRVEGDAQDPLSRGHICPKGTAIPDLQDDPERLRAPCKRVGDSWQTISWSQAFDEISARLCALVDAQGGNSVAVYRGNPGAHNMGLASHGSLISKALGTKNNYSATTIDQIPHQMVGLWMYGHNFIIPVADIDRTDVMLMIGANPLASNGSLWTVPGVKARIRNLHKRGGKLIVVDPRKSETAQEAAHYIPIRPGHDAPMLLGLLLALDDAGLVKPAHLLPLLKDWDTLWTRLRRFSLDWCAAACGLPKATLQQLARTLGEAEHAVVYGRMGVSVTRYGALNQWFIQLLNIATGNLDRIGGAMLTQPANDVIKITGKGGSHRWRSRVSAKPEVLGEFPVGILAEEILTPGDGQIRALITIAGNPVLSNPNGTQLEAALETLDLVVSIDTYITETSRHADYILPPAGALERAHYPTPFFALAVHNSAKYSAPLFERGADTLHDWEILDALARRVAAHTGATLPPTFTPDQVLELSLAKSGRGITLQLLKDNPHGIDLGPLQPCLAERLCTPDKMIHCAPDILLEDLDRLADDAIFASPIVSGLQLIGRRHVRSCNSWMHNIPKLMKGPVRCTLMMHPDDAKPRNLRDGATAKVTSRTGHVELPVELTSDIMPGVVSIPHGFGHGRSGVGWTVAAANAGVSVNDLTDELLADPLTGNAAVNGVAVEVVAAV